MPRYFCYLWGSYMSYITGRLERASPVSAKRYDWCTRYYGRYSSRRRGERAKLSPPPAEEPESDYRTDFRRSSWAASIKRIYEVQGKGDATFFSVGERASEKGSVPFNTRSLSKSLPKKLSRWLRPGSRGSSSRKVRAIRRPERLPSQKMVGSVPDPIEHQGSLGGGR